MDSEKYDRSVTLLCPTCGNSQLETQDGDQEKEIIRCPSCDRTMTKEELIRENGETIDASIDDIKKEVLLDVRNQISNMLKDSFKGSKNIKVK
ncbi:MAG: hypothetical protein PHI97_33665 [Desulfobulbus sp.]|nr:hypothetical protein [Desulfobulbus sp.]